MCKWHKLSIKQVATDPKTGEFDAGVFAVGLTAMAALRVEQDKFNIKDLFANDGFNPEELLTQANQEAFANSGLDNRSEEEVEQSLSQNIEKLREAILNVSNYISLDKDDLNVPKGVTKDGYKVTCCADANPRENGPFLDAAVIYLFKGYDTPEDVKSEYGFDVSGWAYASQDLELISAQELEELSNDPAIPDEDKEYFPMLEGIRSAVEVFFENPEALSILEDTFRDTVAYVYHHAEDDFKNGYGLSGPSSCVMCEGTSHNKTRQP